MREQSSIRRQVLLCGSLVCNRESTHAARHASMVAWARNRAYLAALRG